MMRPQFLYECDSPTESLETQLIDNKYWLAHSWDLQQLFWEMHRTDSNRRFMFSRIVDQKYKGADWFYSTDYCMDFSTWTQYSQPQARRQKQRGARRVRLVFFMPFGVSPPISSTMFEYQYPEIFENVCRVQWNDLQGLDEPNCFNSAGRYSWQAHEWHPHVREQQQLLEKLKPWRVATASWYHTLGGYNKVWGNSPGVWPQAQHHPLLLNDLDTVSAGSPTFSWRKTSLRSHT